MHERSAPGKPHLLVDARTLNGARNGITRFVEQLIAVWPDKPGFRTTLVSNRPIRSNALIPEGIDCLHDDHPSSHLPGTLWMTLRVPALARSLGATHFLGTQHVLPLWRTGRLTQGVIIHDLVFELFPETMTRPNRYLSSYFAPRSIRRADRIFCVSKTTRVDLERYFDGPAKSAIVCYPGRTQAFNGVVPTTSGLPRDIALLIVGSMEPRKNIAPFLRAFLIAADEEPRLRLDLVSGDAWGDVLDELTWSSILQHPRIRIHQRISDPALHALYDAAQYLVFPSLYEGFGLPILEAVGHCAVIANDIPIFREIACMVDGVYLMNLQASPFEMAELLLKLIAASDRSTVADDHGTFSWEVTAKQIIESMDLPLVNSAHSGRSNLMN